VTRELESSSTTSFAGKMSGFLAEAFRYWEPRRILYNAVLAVIVAGHIAVKWPEVKSILTLNVFLGLFFLAVLANICYCAVYAVDLFVRFSELQSAWKVARPLVLLIGTAFAGVITHFFASGLF
jgi:hypothetical protein